MISFRTYVLGFLLLLSPLAALVMANYLFLRGSGEMLAAPEIVDRQRAGFVLYGTAVNNNTYRYKLQMYRAAKPEIVALGSSRVMQLRGWFFRRSFMTMGRAMNSLKEGGMLVDDMLRIHRPRIVLFGLDYWWFNGAVPEATDDHTLTGGELRTAKLLFPVQSMLEGKLTASYVFGTALAGAHDCAGCDRLGLNAAIHSEGFAADGSYYYLGTLSGRRPSFDYRFGRTLGLVAGEIAGTHSFAMPATADPHRLQEFRRIVERFRSEQIEVIVFLPPIAPSVLKTMAVRRDHPSLGEQIARAAPAGVRVFDFTDPSRLGAAADDCEFVDGTHGGDVVYLRMLAAIARLEPGALSGFLIDNAGAKASAAAGLAMINDGPVAPAIDEEDFLGLGCTKRVASHDAGRDRTIKE